MITNFSENPQKKLLSIFPTYNTTFLWQDKKKSEKLLSDGRENFNEKSFGQHAKPLERTSGLHAPKNFPLSLGDMNADNVS